MPRGLPAITLIATIRAMVDKPHKPQGFLQTLESNRAVCGSPMGHAPFAALNSQVHGQRGEK